MYPPDDWRHNAETGKVVQMSATLINVDELTDEQVIELLAQRKAAKKSKEQEAALSAAALVFNELNKLTKKAVDLARNGKSDDLAVLMVEYYSLQDKLKGGYNRETGERLPALSSAGGFTVKRGREILEAREG